MVLLSYKNYFIIRKSIMRTLFKFSMLALFAVAIFSCGGGVQGDKAKTGDAEKVKTTPVATETYMVGGNSTLTWTGSKRFVGGKHTGTLPMKSGRLEVADGQIVGGSFLLNMAGIANTDLEGEGKGQLEGHLKSADFFDVAKHPNAKFEITGTEPITGVADATHKVKGNLTLKGVSKNIEFNAKVVIDGDGVSATTPQFVIDRTQWGIAYGSTDKDSVADDLKDKVISNDIGIQLAIQARRVTN